MGHFLGCFGYSKNQKRRRVANRNVEGEKRVRSYECLDTVGKPIRSSGSDEGSKAKETSSLKVTKKVRFNLTVEVYELIQDDHFLESEGDEDNGKTENSRSFPSEEDDWAATNYRYKNCQDTYDDEEDEMLSADSDLEDYYDDDIDDEDEDETYDTVHDQISSQNESIVANQELRAVDSTQNARDRSQYLHSVLNPVENLSQWKAIKAKPAPHFKHQKQENVVLEENHIPFRSERSFSSLPSNFSERHTQCTPIMKDTAVDASLSNWLTSSQTM